MAAAIPALMGAQMISNLVSGLFQQGNGNNGANTNSYLHGMRDGVLFDEMQHHSRQGSDTNITINNFNPKDRILF